MKKVPFYREEVLPLTEIKKSGNSASITITKNMLKLHNLEVGMKVRPILFIRERLHSNELEKGKCYFIDESGKISKISKSEKVKFEHWKKENNEK